MVGSLIVLCDAECSSLALDDSRWPILESIDGAFRTLRAKM
jgi:hypothetical protein